MTQRKGMRAESIRQQQEMLQGLDPKILKEEDEEAPERLHFSTSDITGGEQSTCP